MSMLTSVGRSLWVFINNHPISKPTPTPPTTIQPKLSVASSQINCPVATATMAKRKIISDEASLSMPSPSSMDDMRLGTFTNFKIALALTASGGETIPPNKNPNANDIPGINVLATSATDSAVKNTTMNAKLVMMRRHLQSSFHEIANAASYNNGGRKMMKISSGSM